MITYRYHKPITLEGRPQTVFENPDFIISISLNNLMLGQCSASTIENIHLRNFFAQDLIKEDTEITYTEASIYKELCTILTNIITKTKKEGYENQESLANNLLKTSFSVDSSTKSISVSTAIQDFYDAARTIAQREGFALDIYSSLPKTKDI